MDTAQLQSSHLAGNLAPVLTEDDFELKVTGRIPEGLNGAFYRNGPNPQFEQGPNYHAFTGDGMVHGFFLKDGKAHYRNRWVRTPRWLAENAAGRALFGGLGRPNDPSVETVNPGGANTNIVMHAGRLMALQEGSEPFEMDPATLNSTGWMHTGGRFTAHPKTDPETGELVWFAYAVGPEPLNAFLEYGVTDPSGRVMRRDRFKAPYCSMIHDFLVTRNYVIFPVLPLTGDFERAKRGGPAFAWEPSKGGWLGVMKRNASVDTIRWIAVDPGYVFHPANAWEDGDTIHAEVMEYPEAPLFPRVDGTKTDATNALLTRWTVDLSDPNARVVKTPLHDIPGEFPRFDERFAGLPYRHVWHAANIVSDDTLVFDALVHIDLKTGKRDVRQLPAGDSFGEPVFVPRHAGAAEGDGWLLVLAYSAARNASDMLILNAQDIAGEPQAALSVPRRVPSGFHGNWAPAA
jgi:carotenoid cleavage dioxygenase